MKAVRWTSSDLEALPNDGKRYEIVEGELYVSKQPHWNHQLVCQNLGLLLGNWNKKTKSGIITAALGVIFANDDDVAPDLIWISNARLVTALEADRKLHSAPELVVEVLSPGSTNESRDREVKRKLYSRFGVSEYWIISWHKRQIEIYRRNQDLEALELIQTLFEADTLKSTLLSGFSCPVSEVFEEVV